MQAARPARQRITASRFSPVPGRRAPARRGILRATQDAQAFAEALRARRLGLCVHSPLEQVHLRSPALRSARPILSHPHLLVAPHWHLTFACNPSPQRPYLVPVARDAAEPSPPALPGFSSATIERVHTRTQRVDTLRWHSDTRYTRVVSHSEPARRAAADAAPSPPPARIERVLRIPVRDAATAHAGQARPLRQAPDEAFHLSMREPGQPPSQATASRAPELSIDRLADRVVSALDRRLLAHRERHGRI